MDKADLCLKTKKGGLTMIYLRKYLACIISFITILGTLTIAASYNNPLSVPFKSQVPPGEWANTNNCGQTCALMVLCYYKGTVPTEQGIKDIDDWLFQKYGDPINNYNGSITNTTKLEALVKEYGGFVNSYKDNGWDLSNLKQKIDEGRPVIAAVTAGYLSNRGYNYAGGHFIVVIGYSDTHIICHDPGTSSGAEKFYSNGEFSLAFSSQSGSVVVVVGTNIDVALIIDSSGSMGWNDPLNLRRRAAKIFVDYAHNDDQIAVIDFDSYSYLRWDLQPLTENREGIKSAIDSIDSWGGTNISRGLLLAYDELSLSSQPYKKAAVLLTDGVGYYNNEADLFSDENWPIYTIGLGYDTNPQLLNEIAEKTGGQYFELTDPYQLKNVYFEIATQLAGGTSLANFSTDMKTGDSYNAFVIVPPSQKSTTFLVSWSHSDVSTTLITPSGLEISENTSDPNVYYAKGLTYELYRITDPEPGEWTISLFGVDLPPEGETVEISVATIGLPIPPDITPPVILVSNPVEGKTYFDQLPTIISFMIEDPESAIISQSATLNGHQINNNDSILLTQLGENSLIITATNEANLTNEVTINFYVNHFCWLPPIKYIIGSTTETKTCESKANSTLPIKFAVFNVLNDFVVDTTINVFVEGTTVQFEYGEGDLKVRINQEEDESIYIVNLHTNFNKCDYSFEADNEYFVSIYFDNILAAKTKLRIR